MQGVARAWPAPRASVRLGSGLARCPPGAPLRLPQPRCAGVCWPRCLSARRYLRGECLNHKYVFGSELPVGRLMSGLADKMQECTQSYVRRPYGVGMLVAGADKTGAHLFQTCPSGNVYEYKAHAIGARAQSARTYLEKHYDGFAALAAAGDKEALLLHALRALASCTEAEEELSVDNASLGVVQVGSGFEVVDGTSMAPLIARLADFNPDPPAAAAAAAGTAADAAAADAADEDDDMAMA